MGFCIPNAKPLKVFRFDEMMDGGFLLSVPRNGSTMIRTKTAPTPEAPRAWGTRWRCNRLTRGSGLWVFGSTG